MEAPGLRYTLDPGELADAMVLHLPSFRAARRRARFGLGLFAAGFLALTLLSVAMLIPFVATAAGFLTAPAMLRRQMLRVVARTSAMSEPVRLTADSEGVAIDADLSHHWYAWRNYQSVVSSSAGVGLVGRGGTVLRWIPARAFASEDDREAWATMARRAIATPVPGGS